MNKKQIFQDSEKLRLSIGAKMTIKYGTPIGSYVENSQEAAKELFRGDWELEK